MRAADYRSTKAAYEAEGLSGAVGPLTVGDAAFRVIGPLGTGEDHDVVQAQRARRLTETVVVKVLRDGGDIARQVTEWQALTALSRSDAQGAPEFFRRLPQPVLRGRLAPGDGRWVTMYRYPSGFVHTFDDVKAAYPLGVGPRHAVWLWRRILESLGWVHAAGWTHGNIEPGHLLVHAPDHGVRVVGWTRAAALTPRGAADDLARTADAVRHVLVSAAPAPLQALLDDPGTVDPFVLSRRVSAAARDLYGPPSFVPFHMPGWPALSPESSYG